MLEIGATDAKPQLTAVLLVGPPISAHGKRLAALAAREGFYPVLPLVVRLQCAEILEGFRTRVVYVIPAPLCTAVTRQAEYSRRLRSSQRLGAFSVLRSMSPHVHLHIVVAIEGLIANGTGELRRADEYLSWGGNPVLALGEPSSGSEASVVIQTRNHVISHTTGFASAILRIRVRRSDMQSHGHIIVGFLFGHIGGLTVRFLGSPRRVRLPRGPEAQNRLCVFFFFFHFFFFIVLFLVSHPRLQVCKRNMPNWPENRRGVDRLGLAGRRDSATVI
eukprot:Gb_38639 [translate_table: standard]